ncbi:MAG: MATE family efflux transporter [Anaerolineae bacterium]|nr:MATE family efflux transporter [Thermoflexales bacterium]MDW8408679.1 MATE family efflux transporter [Anaerolineae bacterium]
MANPPASIALSSLGHLKPESLNRAIITLALPAVLENLLVSAVFVADSFLIGHLNDAAALAAVGISGSYLFIANGLFMALSIGAMALVARAYGEGNAAQAKRIGGQSISLSVALAGVCMAALFPLAEPFLALLIADAEVIRQGTLYIHIILSTSLLAFPLQVMTGIMRAAGDTRTPMYITLFMNVLNIALAAGLIFGVGPISGLGIAGAGWGAAIARAAGGLAGVWVLAKGLSRLRITLREMAVWDWRDVTRLWRIALPSIIDSAIQRVGFLTFTGIVASLGTVVVAANQIANTIESLSFLPGWGFSIATGAIVGQALGARNVAIAELATRRSMILSVSAMSLAGVGFVLFGGEIARAFGATGDVLAQATLAIQLAALEQPFIALQMIYGGALRGAGDTRSPMIVSLIGVIFFRITAVYVLAVQLGLGIAGVWIGTAIDWAGRSAVMYLLYRRGKWKALEI